MYKKIIPFLLAGILAAGCSDFFGSKGDSITDEIFEQGRQDPDVIVDEVGYAALVPFWDGFDQPTDVYVGFDELVYVTDAQGVHVLDRAGRHYDTFELRGAVSVTQDRLLNLYVAARYDTLITAVLPEITPHPDLLYDDCQSFIDDEDEEIPDVCYWDLPAVYKIQGFNQGQPEVIDVLKHPFRRFDISRSNTTLERFRLNRGSANNDEYVEITSVGVLSDNSIYITRRGPANSSTTPFPDNGVLIYDHELDAQGERTGSMRNVGRVNLRAQEPANFFSGIDISDMTTFVGPPQRDNITGNRGFLITQGNEERNIPFRTLWIDAIQTPDGLEFRQNASLQVQDTTQADSFLYEPDRFVNPTGIAYSADARSHLFVVDAGTDSLYLFQSNGREGITPPAGSDFEKAVNVSFGGTGNGPREFNNPSGVAYFRQVVYVADRDNNRIARYKLNIDFE